MTRYLTACLMQDKRLFKLGGSPLSFRLAINGPMA
jgi:hypothetical protein